MATESTSTTRNLLDFIPRDAFDSHMHIIDPNVYPLPSVLAYTPPLATLTSALDAIAPLSQLCIVQPSFYGLDNSCTLEALKSLGKERACAVIELDPALVTEEQMRNWDQAGVRGVRINLVSRAIDADQEELEKAVKSHADLIRPWGWALQLYAPMSAMDFLGDIIPSLGIPVVFDHFAYPSSPLSSSSSPAGFASLLRTLSAPASQLYIKISAPYRLDFPLSDLRPLFDALFHAGSDRLVFATDWPHTRFDGIDTQGWITTAVGWCLENGGERAVEMLFKTNAERLWRGGEKR